MTLSVRYEPEDHLIAVHVDEEININTAEIITKEIIRVSMQHDCFRILADYRQASLNMSTIDIYDLPKRVAAIAVEAGTRVERYRRALVVRGGREDFDFFTTVSMNRGQNARLFVDYQEARQWLIQAGAA